ncbi:MAG: phage holin family protein [Betaproteobacteria bacterium]
MDHQKNTGIWASISRVLATLLDMAQVRLALLGTELEFEKQRLLTALWLGALSLVLLGLGLVLLCATLVLLLWDVYRTGALVGAAVVFLAAGMGVLSQARRRLRSPSGLFHASVTELQRDRDAASSPGKPG